jgi:hypothetical protein
MLAREKKQFAEAYYRRHRSHIVRVMIKLAIMLAVLLILAGVSSFLALHGKNDVAVLSVVVAIFLWIIFVAYRTVRDQFHVRVIPYFERKIGKKDAWLTGQNYLKHSRQLDEIAGRIGVRPLSEFASGDDLVPGEQLQWFLAQDALQTIEKLLNTEVVAEMPAAVASDLTHIRDSLRLACSHGVKFCFLIREGLSASGIEMDKRKGSFF